MANIYIVMGFTGEHSDFMEWPVAAFTSARRAATWQNRCIEWMRERGWWNEYGTAYVGHVSTPDRVENPYDPGYHVDYTGVGYSVSTVRLNPALPKKGAT